MAVATNWPKYEVHFVFQSSNRCAISYSAAASAFRSVKRQPHLLEFGLRKAKTKSETVTHDPWPLTERPGFLIRRLHQIHVALFHDACGEFDLTPVQYSLLSALHERGSADQTTLAADVSLDRTTTTGALKRLAARKLIERSINLKDRRARACKLTSAGTVLLLKMEAGARAAHRRTVAHLSQREQAVLVRLMQRLVSQTSCGTVPSAGMEIKG